ncbi:J domain-containing protein [archaeon]|nr:MAG: J domain-containing protein [archaeon]
MDYRIFQLTQAVGQTLDPSSFKVTNTFPYDKISLSADEKNSDQVVLELDKTTYVYKTAYRSHMLCQMFECITKKAPSKLPSFGPFDGLRLRKNGVQVQCQLFIVSFGIVEQDIYGNILQEYKWVNILRFGADEQNQAFFFEYSGRTKIFYMQNLDRLIQVCKGQIKQLGMDKVPYVPNQTVSVIMKYRLEAYSSIPAAVSVFDVNKYTRRSPRPLSRQLHISEEFVTEMDASGFQFVSFQPVSMIYALVRSWDNPRQFTIEYNDGSHRKYTCSTRDTLLAMLLDVCHAAGNVRVIVTGEISDGHRLMPRFAEEEYQASMKDAFFGADSIEMWFLKRLQHACKHSADADTIISACRDLNANVPCPGISANSDPNRVKAVLIGVLKILQDEVIRAASVDRLDNSRGVAVLLQTLYRLIPSTCGYKAFVEVKEVDTRVLLLQLLKFDNNFVNYWTLEVLLVLCKCPLAPRNMQQEFVNKHSVLTTTMLKHLLELMSYRIDIPEATSTVADDSLIVPVDSADASSRADSSSAVGPTVASAVSAALGGKTLEQNAAPATSQKRVATNPSAFSHIPAGSMRNNQTEEKVVEQKEVTEKKDEPAASTADLYFFTPNSLVVIGAAQLLESIVSSRKDTTSPELLKEVLDLLAERYDILVSMLRSTSFLILENAAILMFCLLKNRPMVATGFKEMVLCDALVLKHFYNAIFSPSGTQRFLSRFLIATWLSGSVTTNPGKALLTRMIPSGLVEYLKFGAISEEHRQNLDSMEDDFYANFANSVGVGKKSSQIKTNSSAMQQRMRKRIATALREQVAAFVPPAANMDHPSSTGTHIPPSPPLSTAPTPAPATNAGGSGRQPENYRVMFHMMTQSHKLPDLIWNDQTRLELRNALESEIKSFEREQRLRGTQKIAWNFQQFSVRYESLREEIQVGPIYIRYFLEAGTSFLRQLQNPPPDVFFEKLFRRVLVNIQFNANLAILCTRCITQLYEACRDLIGSFDDMAIVVRMLEQASNLELQQHLLDLLISLCQDDSNLLQLLDKGFVDTMIKYVSLAHINPDQIGNVLARATNSMLLIKDADNIKISTLSSAVQDRNSEPSEEAIAKQQRRSLWVPDDGACPKVWFAAPMGQLPPPKQAQKGPYRVSELLNEYESGHINDSWLVAPVTTEENDEQRFEALVDTGRWKRVEEYFQLRLQLLYPGKALYSPAQVASKCLMLLLKLAAIHKSSNFKSIPFYPIAMSKRIMSESTHLSVFAQLLLSNDPTVVDNAADLLRSLVEFNLQACSKLYLTGVYFFAARYTGNNYIAIANFFHSTHLRQSFHDSSEIAGGDISLSAKSVLGSLFPPAMICILNNYGSERFAGVQTGDFDTPEVIWNAELRRHLVEMVEAHLGDFSARLRQHSLGTYEYCPIPKIHYQSLDRELYVHEYYLRNLCDEMRFPDWPIGEPLLLLRECLERWREEMTKGIPDSAVSEAKKILSLPDRFDNADLRKAYKNLARQYHPDKNPAGRDMFEKIQKAYELLSSVELQVTETDLNNVLLLIKTQIILYRRFPGNIGDQKYPAYSLLVEVTKISSLGVVPSGQDAELLVACTRLMYYTTHVSPLNVREFVKSGAVAKLYGIIEYAMSIRENIVGAQLAIDVLVPALKTFTSVANIEEGRAELIKLCPKFSEDVYSMLSLRKSIPLAVENAIEIISRCCSSVDLQTRFIEAGVIWRLVPLLLEYDSTLKDDYSDESQRTAPNQCAYNMHAVLAAKALGRLGGYMFEDLSSPPNDQVKQCLANLLTGPLAKLLRNRRPWDLLESLNQSVEACTRIWNVGMRSELMEFALKVDRNRPLGSSATDLQPANDFKFTCLRDELCVGGVYVRIFNKSGDTSDIDDPSKFCGQLIDFIYSTRSEPSLTPVQRVHLDHAVEGLKVLSEFRPYVPYDIAKHEHGVAVVFGLLEMPPESSCFVNTAHLLTILFNSADFVSVVSKMNPPIIWKLLKCLCTVSGDTVQNVWTAAEALVSSTDGLTSLLEADAVIKMLAILIAVPGCVNSYQCRLSAISLLSKCLWNPVKGADVSSTLRR